MNKLGIYLGLMVFSAAVLAAPAGAVDAAKTKAKAGGPADLYKAKCASCHGAKGQGNPNMAKVFKLDNSALDLTDKATLDKTDEELNALTTDGHGKMPAFKGKISDADIAALTTYFRAFAAAPAEKK